MRKRLLLVTVPLLLAMALVPTTARAQVKGDIEAFLGVDYFNLDLPDVEGSAQDERLSMWGLHGQLVFYFNDHVGVVLDGVFPQGDVTFAVEDTSATVEFNQAIYLGGIQYRLNPGGNLVPSFQGLIGWYNGSVGTLRVEGIDQPVLIGLAESGFSYGVGANLDLRLSEDVALRLLHAGLVWTSYGDSTQTNPRLSFGIVGRF